ncbi:MAG: ABC transporter ATP-binding protein [Eubacteriales bacterium]
MTTQKVITVTDIKKQFDREIVLDNIGFSVEQGEILGVLGPSGSGKTTLIKCIVGMHRLDAGHLEIMGRKMPDIDLMDSIGYMAQMDALYEDLTGMQNLVFFARLKGMKKKGALQEARQLFKLVNLEKDTDKKVVNYSGGMKRRLSLIAALIGDPDVIILDEPTVGIDPVLRELFWAEFYRRQNRGKTIIITTHAMDEADKCSRLLLLRGGKILENGTPGDMKKAYGLSSIEQIFIESAKEDDRQKEAAL